MKRRYTAELQRLGKMTTEKIDLDDALVIKLLEAGIFALIFTDRGLKEFMRAISKLDKPKKRRLRK